MNMQKKGMTGKDIITVGIFSAIYFVINFAFMLLGGIHPVLWMLMPGFIAVFAGIPPALPGPAFTVCGWAEPGSPAAICKKPTCAPPKNTPLIWRPTS